MESSHPDDEAVPMALEIRSCFILYGFFVLPGPA